MRAALAAALLLLLSGASQAQSPTAFHIDQDSVPAVFSSFGQGSAFVVGRDVLVSANHVLGRGNPVAWWRGGYSPVRRTCSVERSDIAVGESSVPQSARALSVAARVPQVGEVVMAAGHRSGEFVQVLTQVIDLKDQVTVVDRRTRVQTDIGPVAVLRYGGPSPSGMSGGPVMDANGMVFAVMVAFEGDGAMSAALMSSLKGRCQL